MRIAKLSPAFLLFLVLLTVGFSLSAAAPQISTASGAGKLVFYQFAPYYTAAPEYQAMIELNNASQTAAEKASNSASSAGSRRAASASNNSASAAHQASSDERSWAPACSAS